MVADFNPCTRPDPAGAGSPPIPLIPGLAMIPASPRTSNSNLISRQLRFNCQSITVKILLLGLTLPAPLPTRPRRAPSPSPAGASVSLIIWSSDDEGRRGALFVSRQLVLCRSGAAREVVSMTIPSKTLRPISEKCWVSRCRRRIFEARGDKWRGVLKWTPRFELSTSIGLMDLLI